MNATNIVRSWFHNSNCGFVSHFVDNIMRNQDYIATLAETNSYLMGDIHLGKGSSHELVNLASDFFFTDRPKYQEGNPKIREIEGSTDF